MIESRLNHELERARTIDHLASSLEWLLNSGCYVWVETNAKPTLLFGRALVEKINGLKIHIYSDEHAPPHFHVISSEIDAAFSIQDCRLLKGSVERKTLDLILYWHGSARQKLIEIWNQTRPTDCPVGTIDQ